MEDHGLFLKMGKKVTGKSKKDEGVRVKGLCGFFNHKWDLCLQALVLDPRMNLRIIKCLI